MPTGQGSPILNGNVTSASVRLPNDGNTPEVLWVSEMLYLKLHVQLCIVLHKIL